jgi:hypothetical protein
MRQSAKTKALQRSRQEAIANGTLQEWYAQQSAKREAEKLQSAGRHAEKLLSPDENDGCPSLLSQEPYTPSPEFQRAYSGPPITPEFAQWDDRGFMRWNGPMHELTRTPRRAYTPRVI